MSTFLLACLRFYVLFRFVGILNTNQNALFPLSQRDLKKVELLRKRPEVQANPDLLDEVRYVASGILEDINVWAVDDVYG